MSAQPETVKRLTVHANDKLASNAERLAWQAHQLAVEIADHKPSAVSHALRRAAIAQWRRLYLDLPG